MSNQIESHRQAFSRRAPALAAGFLVVAMSAAGPARALAQQVPEPSFTPMTIRPALTNADEVRQALIAAYPPALRDAGVGGAPMMWLYIGTDGTIQATRIAETSGIEAIDRAAEQVAGAMRFSPARNGDEIVAVWVQLPIRFRVEN